MQSSGSYITYSLRWESRSHSGISSAKNRLKVDSANGSFNYGGFITYMFRLSLTDGVRPAQRQILWRIRGDVLHHLLHLWVPAAPDVHPRPQVFRTQCAEHRRPDCHPAALPADDPGALRGRGRAPALGGHWDCGSCGKGNTELLLVVSGEDLLVSLFFFFLCCRSVRYWGSCVWCESSGSWS